MAEISALFFAASASSISPCRYFSPSSSSSSSYPSPFYLHRTSSFSAPFRLAVKAASNFGGIFRNDDDQYPYGSYPWEHHSADSDSDSDSGIQWVPEDKITLFTADGLIQLGGSVVPRHISPSEKQQGKLKTYQKYQRFQESDYMDPKQSLCLGALFDIAATNGLDTGRRLCIIGFCRSIEMLSDIVEDTVLEQGGEVVAAEKATTSGLQEKLRMTVAVPLLWGVPPASETLHLAVRSGGGIVDKEMSNIAVLRINT